MNLRDIAIDENGTQSLTRAFDRVAALKLRVLRRSDGGYRVHSSSNKDIYYDIHVYIGPPSRITCSCPAHQFGRVCKHIAAVLLRLEREGTLDMLTDNMNFPEDYNKEGKSIYA